MVERSPIGHATNQKRKTAKGMSDEANTTNIESNEGELVVRPARAEDREAVFAFCARTWGDDGDYIPYVWDKWLADMNGDSALHGVVLVATLDGRPVGITHVRMLSDDEAWIEGVRVDPAERRTGVGRALIGHALKAAQAFGATVARFFTDETNVASQQLFARFGFTRIAQMLRYAAPALTFGNETAAQDGRTTKATAKESAENALAAAGLADDPVGLQLTTLGEDAFERIWEWLTHSTLTPFNGGLEFIGWTARGLREPTLREYLAGGKVWLLEGWDTILALAIAEGQDDEEPDEDLVEEESETEIPNKDEAYFSVAKPEANGNSDDRAIPRGKALDVRYVDGSADGLSRLCLALREVAGQRGLARVRLWLPELLILADAMAGAGYERRGDEAMWVYQRAL